MAGDWIEWSKGLARKPEVLAIAQDLHMSRFEVAGRLMEVWEWFDDNSRDGNAFVTLQALQGCNVASLEFLEAMKKQRWLVVKKSGVIIPNWERHNSQSAKERALTRRRVAKFRNDSVTPAALPQKRTEQKSIIPPIAPQAGGGKKLRFALSPELHQRLGQALSDPAEKASIKASMSDIVDVLGKIASLWPKWKPTDEEIFEWGILLSRIERTRARRAASYLFGHLKYPTPNQASFYEALQVIR